VREKTATSRIAWKEFEERDNNGCSTAMVSVHIPVEPADLDDLVAVLNDAGTLGIVEGDGTIEAFFSDLETAARFGKPCEWPDTDWVQKTEDSFTPILAGQKFFVVAPWRTDPTPPGRFRLVINPSFQCGTGYHPCTKLCLEALEKMIRPGDAVLDVGSGSGILSRAARMLGAGRVVACDIDPDAGLAEALHDFTTGDIPFFVGSSDAVRGGAFDIVVANISEAVLDELNADLQRVAPRRILSGFQDERGGWTCVTG
jgi:ribosomal protein L11 methyltransferase